MSASVRYARVVRTRWLGRCLIAAACFMVGLPCAFAQASVQTVGPSAVQSARPSVAQAAAQSAGQAPAPTPAQPSPRTSVRRVPAGSAANVNVPSPSVHGATPSIPPSGLTSVTVLHEEGVEIITARTVKPTPVANPATATVAAVAPPTTSDVAAAAEAGEASRTQLDPSGMKVVAPTQGLAAKAASTMNASLPTPYAGPLDDDLRGDHRLRANLLNADGTPNEEADNSAHRMINARRAHIQADLKDALKSFDDGKRNGANRNQLNQLQARIRTDLDEIDMLTRSQQSGAQ